jgi:hypothetical protein
LYEIAFLAFVALGVSLPARLREGARFRIFLGSYLAWRLAIDFLKPQPLVWGMSLIQWTCVAGLCALGVLGWLDLRSASSRTPAQAAITGTN